MRASDPKDWMESNKLQLNEDIFYRLSYNSDCDTEKSNKGIYEQMNEDSFYRLTTPIVTKI